MVSVANHDHNLVFPEFPKFGSEFFHSTFHTPLTYPFSMARDIEDGRLSFLTFNLSDARAARRLALAESTEGNKKLLSAAVASEHLGSQKNSIDGIVSQVLSHKMALVYVIAHWQSASSSLSLSILVEKHREKAGKCQVKCKQPSTSMRGLSGPENWAGLWTIADHAAMAE